MDELDYSLTPTAHFMSQMPPGGKEDVRAFADALLDAGAITERMHEIILGTYAEGDRRSPARAVAPGKIDATLTRALGDRRPSRPLARAIRLAVHLLPDHLRVAARDWADR